MFDLKVIHSVLKQLEEERGISKERVIEAIELSLASAYKKEYGKKGQIVKATFDLNTGSVDFSQVKIVKAPEDIIMEDEEINENDLEDPENIRIRYNPEQHILINEARMIKKDAQVDDEIIFPLEKRDDFGRIAAQTAKQVITQKIREAEKTSVLSEFGEHEGNIVSGTVQRIERGIIYLDMGRAIGQLPYEEQIPNERFKQGGRVRAYLMKVEESPRGVFLRVSRSHPKFLEELFKAEVPELASETVEIKAIAREAGARSKVAVCSNDDHIDPVGSLVGQRGVRVSTITSELGGEKIDIVEWSEDTKKFIREALSPAEIIEIELNEETRTAKVLVSEDQQSLAIGKGGQNARLAAKLTGWKIDIRSTNPSPNKESKKTTENTGVEDINTAPSSVISEENEAKENEKPEEIELSNTSPEENTSEESVEPKEIESKD